jgi:hypothetical protein
VLPLATQQMHVVSEQDVRPDLNVANDAIRPDVNIVSNRRVWTRQEGAEADLEIGPTRCESQTVELGAKVIARETGNQAEPLCRTSKGSITQQHPAQ